MAIVVPGARCKICGKPMEQTDDLVGFPSFVVETDNPLNFFSDAAFHRNCLKEHPLADAAAKELHRVRDEGYQQIGNELSFDNWYFHTTTGTQHVFPFEDSRADGS